MVLFVTVNDILLTGIESFSAVHTSKHIQTQRDLNYFKDVFEKKKQSRTVIFSPRPDSS